MKIATPKITPFLWYDTQAEAAAKHYVETFPNSKINNVLYHGEGAMMPKGMVMTVDFELAGQHFTALNGGPMYSFSGGISFLIHCDDQEEVDHYWNKLTEGGSAIQCGWLTDKFGLTWQVVPSVLIKLMTDPNPKKAQAVMQAMMPMKKLVIAELQAAYDKG